jgi:aquaporin related protein
MPFTADDFDPPSVPGTPLRPFSLMYVAASFGAALAVNVWVFYRVTGGMFNPAVGLLFQLRKAPSLEAHTTLEQVTLGLLLAGAVKPLRALVLLPTQLVAAICAAAVVDAIIPGPLTVGNALANGTNTAQGLFLEMFLTSQLVITVYFLAVEKHRATFLAPIGIGLSVFIAHIVGTNYTGTSINPARSFGPAVIQGFPGYHWIFWLGPVLGTFLAFAVFSILKWLEYGTANPGQDADDVEAANRAATRYDNTNGSMDKETQRRSRRDSVMEEGQASNQLDRETL